MCAIVDANMMSNALSERTEFQGLSKYLRGHGKIVFSRPLLEEYKANRKFLRVVEELTRFQRARLIVTQALPSRVKNFVRSNDHHILELARTSGVRVLCTCDRKLQKDFRDKRIISPKGRIYQGEGSEGVLNVPCTFN